MSASGGVTIRVRGQINGEPGKRSPAVEGGERSCPKTTRSTRSSTAGSGRCQRIASKGERHQQSCSDTENNIPGCPQENRCRSACPLGQMEGRKASKGKSLKWSPRESHRSPNPARGAFRHAHVGLHAGLEGQPKVQQPTEMCSESWRYSLTARPIQSRRRLRFGGSEGNKTLFESVELESVEDVSSRGSS